MNNPKVPASGEILNAETIPLKIKDGDGDAHSQRSLGTITKLNIKEKMKPDYDELMKHIEGTHIRGKEGKALDCCCEICCYHVGNNWCVCTSKDAKKDENLGLGVSLYFKFVKTTIWYLILAAIINSSTISIYYQSKDHINKISVL